MKLADSLWQESDDGFHQDYPVYHTRFYPAYCYSNRENFTFKIGCTTQLLFTLVALLNIGPITFVLLIEIRIQQQTGWRRPMKFLILVLMIVVQLIVFMHYTIIFPHEAVRTFILIIQSLIRNMCFLLVCYLFCKNASKLLPKRKKWLSGLKMVGLASIIGYLLLAWAKTQAQNSIWTSCKTNTFMLMQIVGSLLSCTFLIVGLLIQSQLKTLSPSTNVDRKIQSQSRTNKALRQICICMATLIVVNAYLLLYAMALYFSSVDCTAIFDHHYFANQVIWFVSRGMADFFWIYPFLYVFWPKKATMIERMSNQLHSPSYSERLDILTVYDSDDEVETMRPYRRSTIGSRLSARTQAAVTEGLMFNFENTDTGTTRPMGSESIPREQRRAGYKIQETSTNESVNTNNILLMDSVPERSNAENVDQGVMALASTDMKIDISQLPEEFRADSTNSRAPQLIYSRQGRCSLSSDALSRNSETHSHYQSQRSSMISSDARACRI